MLGNVVLPSGQNKPRLAEDDVLLHSSLMNNLD